MEENVQIKIFETPYNSIRVLIDKKFINTTYKTSHHIHNQLINHKFSMSLFVLKLDALSIWGGADFNDDNYIGWEFPIELNYILEKYIPKWKLDYTN